MTPDEIYTEVSESIVDDSLKATQDWHWLVQEARFAKFGHRADLSAEANRQAGLRLARQLIQDEVEEFFEATWENGPEGEAHQAKEASDIVFVLAQYLFYLGIDFEAVHREVLRSNYSKLVEPTFRKDGKLEKGPHFSPADIEGVIACSRGE